MSVVIVKVQRPLGSNNKEQPWLIYDKERTHVEEIPEAVIPDHVKKAMGDDFKAYFHGAWSSIVGWGISDRISNQNW